MKLPDPEIIAQGVPPDAAIEFWKQRAKLTDAEAKALGENAKFRAFYVTGLAKQDLVHLVSDGLLAALEKGETLADFKGRITEAIAAEGWHDYRVENIFRTNLQTAYAAGRYQKMQAVKATRPYWLYMAVMDKRVRPSHAILQGLVYHADHAFWGTNYPPNGFRCRCGVRTLSARQVEKQGLTIQQTMPEAGVWTDPKTNMEYFVNFPGADKGFAHNPGKDWVAGLDLNKYPDLTPKSYEEQRGAGGTRPDPVKSYAELCVAIKERCGHFATNNGITGVTVHNSSQYFMATYCDGRFMLSSHKFTLGEGKTFRPAGELKSAWNKLAKGDPLAWNEEYAMESLWHEITHNRQKAGNIGNYDTPKCRAMEIFTQWTARRTYPQFLESLGGKALHQADILKNGLGYGIRIKNFDRLLQVLKVSEGDVLKEMLRLMKTVSRADYDSELKKLLAKLSGKNFMGIAAALEDIDVTDFEKVLRRVDLKD